MIDWISKRFVNILLKNGCIPEQDLEIYRFGMKVTILKLIHMESTLIIGVCFGMVTETIAFIMAYSAIRVYAGGYHAKTSIGCYGCTLAIITFVLEVVKTYPLRIVWYECIVVLILSGIIIAVIAPEGSSNKPLDRLEKSKYHKFTLIILCALEFLAFVLIVTFRSSFGLVITIVLGIESFMLILGSALTKFTLST
jgi:accessory gene regulator B